MADFDQSFDFERHIDQPQAAPSGALAITDGGPGQKIKNYRQTVCTYWLKGMCMKGDECGFLHEFDPSRMPVCRNIVKYGECKEPNCHFKHNAEEVKECNMYKLGFCIYGPTCRYRHVFSRGPPPDPAAIEACKPKEHRNFNLIAGVPPAPGRQQQPPPPPGGRMLQIQSQQQLQRHSVDGQGSGGPQQSMQQQQEWGGGGSQQDRGMHTQRKPGQPMLQAGSYGGFQHRY